MFVERLRNREEAAFSQAVRLYSPVMLSVARGLLDHSSAEDVVQDTWVAVIDAIDGFESRSSLKTWLCTITANRARNRIRKYARETLVDFQDPLEDSLTRRFNDKGGWSHPVSDWSGADHLLERDALQGCLDKHIELLPEVQRGLLTLKDMKQLSVEDICSILNLTPANFRVILHRARQKIFLMVEQFSETGEC